MDKINAVLACAPPTRLPRRDIDGSVARGRKFPVPKTHPFTTANQEEGKPHD